MNYWLIDYLIYCLRTRLLCLFHLFLCHEILCLGVDLSCVQTLYCQTAVSMFFVIWCVASNSRVTGAWLERIWRKWSWPNLRYYPVIFLKDFDILCQDCWSSGRDMTLILHEYKAELFPSGPQHLVSSIGMIWHEWRHEKLWIILVCKSLGNRTFGRLSNRWKNNTMFSVLDQRTYWSDTE